MTYQNLTKPFLFRWVSDHLFLIIRGLGIHCQTCILFRGSPGIQLINAFYDFFIILYHPKLINIWIEKWFTIAAVSLSVK